VLRIAADGERWRIETQMVGFPIYLDTHSFIALAKRKNKALRIRFLTALRQRATLLFSVANAVEVTGPQGDSLEAVKALLSDIGPHWVPVDMDPGAIMKREESGYPAPVMCERFVKAYAHDRLTDMELLGQVVDTSDPKLFDLGKVIGWTKRKRDKVRADYDGMDAKLGAYLKTLRKFYDAGLRAIDKNEADPLHPDKRATYVAGQLTRMIIQDAKRHPFQPHDSLDFCHAVVALTYAVLATLDKKWCNRAARMRHKDQLADVYHGGQLEQFVGALESGVYVLSGTVRQTVTAKAPQAP
jgi:hypothetical protein